MTPQIILSGISVEELVARLKEELTPPPPIILQEPPEDFITVKEVAKLLNVSEVTIHKWKSDGKLKFHRFGSRIRFKKSEILTVEKIKVSKRKKN